MTAPSSPRRRGAIGLLPARLAGGGGGLAGLRLEPSDHPRRPADNTEFLPDTEQFAATVQSLGWSPLKTEVVPGPHGWEAWQVEAQDSLEWLGRLWGANLLHIPAVPAHAIPRDGCAS